MRRLLFLFVPLFLFGSADSDRALKHMKLEQRIALVIGNNIYDHKRLSTLQNPVNDAKAMKSKLEQLGFTIIYGENLRVRDMDKKLDEFTSLLARGGVGLFFFAGHGLEYQGINYLMGKDSKVDDKNDVKYESLPLNKALDAMQDAGNRLNIVLLDACRNDPFSRSSGGGLAKSTARGTFIAYATSPGDVASDGAGKHGVFTENLLKHIDKAGMPIELMLKAVKRDVIDQTQGSQRPWTNSDITGDFFFVLPEEAWEYKTDFGVTTAQKSKQMTDSEEEQLWEKVVYENSKGSYELYLKQYPEGIFSALASTQLSLLAEAAMAAKEAKRMQELAEKGVISSNMLESSISKHRQRLAEKEAWEKIKNATTSQAYEEFLKNYPNGLYTVPAKFKAQKYRTLSRHSK